MKTSMALGRRYSRFMLDAFSKNSNVGLTTISQQFSCRLNNNPKGWFHNPKGARLSLLLLGVGAAVGICSGKSVTVPYTERIHFIFFHKFLERLRAQQLPIKFEGEGETVVPPLHPDSITARRIFEDIMDQAQRSIKNRLVSRFRPYWWDLLRWGLFQMELETEELKCSEIIVLDSPALTPKSTHGFFGNGKLYVTTGLLRHHRDHQSMIATHIGRLVGHELARHHEEMLSKFISTLSVIGTSVYLFSQSKFMPFFHLDKLMQRRFLPSFGFVAIVVPTVVLCLTNYRRKMIMEADDVGMMLASSAGYTLRVGPRYSVSGIQLGESMLLEFLSPIPSLRRRAAHLSRPEILDKALSIYRKSKKYHHDKKTDSRDDDNDDGDDLEDDVLSLFKEESNAED